MGYSEIMGVEKNIDIKKFPKQSDWIGKNVRVCFNYDSTKEIEGVIVRDDMESPGRTIIKLKDGRYVLATECQYGLSKED